MGSASTILLRLLHIALVIALIATPIAPVFAVPALESVASDQADAAPCSRPLGDCGAKGSLDAYHCHCFCHNTIRPCADVFFPAKAKSVSASPEAAFIDLAPRPDTPPPRA